MNQQRLSRGEKALNDLVETLWLLMIEAEKKMPQVEQHKHKQKLKRMIRMVLMTWR